MKITIEEIDHDKQRYPTVGDWYWEDPVKKEHLLIRVSKMPGRWEHGMLVVVHELIEVLLCMNKGITQEDVDRFDIAYEKTRPKDDVSSEPGDHEDAPYRDQHCFATGIERLMAAQLGVGWDKYATEIESLP